MPQQPAEPAAGGKAAGSRAASAAASAAGARDGGQQGGAAACTSSETTAAAAAAAPPPLLPYVLGAGGRKQPLPGAVPLFLRGATVAALGLAAAPDATSSSSEPCGAASTSSSTAAVAAAAPSRCMRSVAREVLLADVRFQGAISDFHAVKDALAAADYDPLLLQPLEDDEFADGSNWQLALSRAAADAWLAADAAAAAAAATAAASAATDAAADDELLDAGARRGQRRAPRPWQDQGTEAELAAAGVLTASAKAAAAAALGPAAARAAGPAAGAGSSAALVLSRPRRAFGEQLALGDAAAPELWASSSMEARPFKDASYELKRAVQEAGAQAVPALREAAVQATGGRPRPGCSQTSPQQLAAEQAESLLASDGFARFLADALPRLDEALLQNAVGDVLADDLQLLGDDDPDSAAAGNASSSGAGASSAGGRAAPARGSSGTGPSGGAAAGRPEHGGLTEAQSFTDLAFSKNKVVTALAWLPHCPGLVAAAVTDPGSMTDRVSSFGRLAPAHVLIWDARDPIHPEHVLESPHEVFCFAYNPANPDLIVGGCYNGQLVVWDTSGLALGGGGRAAGPRASAVGSGARGAAAVAAAAAGGTSWDNAAGEEAATPVVRHKFMSAVEFSHTCCVGDVMWLPGLEVDRAGKVFAIRAHSAGTSAQAFMRSMTLGATALAAANAGSNVPRDCCFFASIAADGKVMFWDLRIEKLLKKGNKRLDDSELVWRPMHVVHLLSMAGSDFAGCCFTFDPVRLESGAFTAGSLDGELLAGSFVRPPGDEPPDHTRSLFAPHVGPLVALSPSPFLPELLLTADAWCWRLWAGAGARTPLFASPFADEQYTAAAWSPSRPGLLFLTTAAGCLQVWDLLDRSHEPSLAPRLSGAALTSICFSTAPPRHATVAAAQEAGGGGSSGAAQTSGLQPHLSGGGSSSSQQLLAVGDAAGVLRLYELPRTLRRPLPNERRLMAAFVAREAARCEDVAARQPLRAEALERQEEARRAAEDGGGGGMADAAGARDTLSAAGGSGSAWAATPSASGARASSVGAGLLSAAGGKAAAAAPSPIVSLSGGQQPGRSCVAAAATGPRLSSAAGGSGAAAEAAALDAEERQYRTLEAQFRAQLGLAAPS